MSVRTWALRILGLGSMVLVLGGTAALMPTLGPTAAQESTAAPESTPAPEPGRPIQVFFSRRPEPPDDFTAVFPVMRTAPDAGVARAALNALIAGPTPEEAADGYYSELGQMLNSPSTCGGPDYTLRIEAGTATVRLCRQVSSAGIGQDARAQSALDATLRQFSTVQRVRLLDREGNCLFDMSGLNRCLTMP